MKDTKKKKIVSGDLITLLAVGLAFGIVCLMIYGNLATRQFSSMIISVSCYIVLAVSLNLVVGLLGELSLGHAGFMSAGLFPGCLLSIALSDSLPLILRMPLSMLLGGIFAALVGFLVGLPALRLKGDYLAIVTLGCGEIIKSVITNLDITGGALGLDTHPIYSNTKTLLPYALVLVFLSILATMNLKKSRQGRAMMAIRDNRIAAELTGINVTYYKLIVFMIAAFFAGAAGVLYGHSLANVKAVSFDYNMSIEILVIVVLGGMGSIRGSISAALVRQALPEMLREFSDYRMLAYSVLLIVIMLFNANPRLVAWKAQFHPLQTLRKRITSKKSQNGDSGKEEEV